MRFFTWHGCVVLGVSLVGCSGLASAPPYDGPVGWLSDRAVEFSVEHEGAVLATHEPLRAIEARERALDVERQRAGAPLLVEGHRLTVLSMHPEGPTLTYRVRIEGLASDLEGRIDAYPDALRPPLDAHPRTTLTRAERGLSVVVFIGQMDTEKLASDDLGFGTRERFERGLAGAGYVSDAKGRFSRPDGVEVTVFGPEDWPFRATDQAPGPAGARLEGALQTAQVVFINGHASQSTVERLLDPEVWMNARTTLLVLDVCFGYGKYVRGVLEASTEARGPDRLEVVSVPGRVVTGSEASLFVLLEALTERETRPWVSILGTMNTLADARAQAREAAVAPYLEPPERYGVAGVSASSTRSAGSAR
jgi:hypothetical protein